MNTKNDGGPFRKLSALLLAIYGQIEQLRAAVETALAQSGHPPNPDGKPPDAESDGELRLAGVPAKEFKATPYFHVGRSVLRDGRNGSAMAENVLKGAERWIVAHLLTYPSIHVADVIAYRANGESGTIYDRKRHAEATIAKIKAAVGAILIIGKVDGRRSWAWATKKNATIPIEFSIDRAVELSKQAERELDANRPSDALRLALEAIDEDDCVQLAHEVVCRAALAISSTLKLDALRVRKSMLVLDARITQLRRVRAVISRSLPYIDDDKGQTELRGLEAKFAEEQKRLESILVRMIARFGDPHGNDRPEDVVVNDMIKQFRAERLTPEQARFDSRSQTILSHPSVNRWRKKIERLALEKKLSDAGLVGQTFNVNAVVRALDVQIAASIRLISSYAYWDTRKTLLPSVWDSAEGRDAMKLRDAKDSFRMQHERYPDTEELAEEVGWTVERVKEIERWIRLQGPQSSDSGEWQEPEWDRD